MTSSGRKINHHLSANNSDLFRRRTVQVTHSRAQLDLAIRNFIVDLLGTPGVTAEVLYYWLGLQRSRHRPGMRDLT